MQDNNINFSYYLNPLVNGLFPEEFLIVIFFRIINLYHYI